MTSNPSLHAAGGGAHVGGGAPAPVAHARALGGTPRNERQRAAVVCRRGHQLQVADLVHAALDEGHHELGQLGQRGHVDFRGALGDRHPCGLCMRE